MLKIVPDDFFEPPHDRIKTCCLTAWRRPNYFYSSSSLLPGGLFGLSLPWHVHNTLRTAHSSIAWLKYLFKSTILFSQIR